MKEWIKEQQRRYLDEPRLKELTEVMKQTRVLVRKKEYRKLSELVRRYRKSEDVITQVSCLLSASYLFPTPEKTAETDRSELMEALKDTYFMEKNGSRLMDIRPEEAVPVHRMLAMYTFMQEVYSKENPESKQERPSPQEVRSSVRILDFHRKESDMWELCNLAVHLMPPSRYVALRYGLADDYDRLDRLNRSGPEPAYDEGGDIGKPSVQECGKGCGKHQGCPSAGFLFGKTGWRTGDFGTDCGLTGCGSRHPANQS